MALSSSESALLTETCTNMNIAANTCREVLEMLRNLGNTGVVDIATHNNAATAHADATNLAHQDAQHGIHYGTLGVSDLHETFYPIQLGLTQASSYMMLINEQKGANTGGNFIASYKGLTDSNSNAIEIDEASQALGYDFIHTLRIACTLTGLDNGNRKDLVSSLNFWNGSAFHAKNYRYSSCRIVLCNGSTAADIYDFTSEALLPYTTNSVDLGYSTKVWKGAYLATSPVVTSDRREKTNVNAIDTKAVDFVKALRPVQFTVRAGSQNVLEADEDGNPTNVETIPGTRRHWGLIAQEVQEALVSAGYDPSDCAVWSLADKNDPDSKQALRYEELIAPMIKVIQNQQERIEALERKVA